MNILIITQMYSQPDDSGDNKPTKTVNYFARDWSSLGHNVVVMHCPSKFPLVYYFVPSFIKDKISGRISTMTPPVESRRDLHRDENGVDVYRFPMLKMYPGQPFSKKAMQKHAKKICNTLDSIRFIPDFVAGHFANPSAELVRIISSHYHTRSSIVFHHDCSPSEIIKYRLEENCRGISVIGARSILEAKNIQKDLKLRKLPFVCYSGVPNDAVTNKNTDCKKHDYSNGVKYVYVGSMIKRKHLDVVIRAFAFVANPMDSLTIIGGGPEEDNIKRLVEDLQISDKVAFTGRIDRSEVLKRLQDCHIFTLISDDETFGMVYCEAMLEGCLTIASKGGGFDGIITDKSNGFICPPGDEKELIKIYKKIISMDIPTRNEIAQRAIQTALHLSEKEVAELYLNTILTD